MYLDLNFILLASALICGIFWYYKKYISAYAGFPSVNLLSHVIKSLLFSKIPKDMPVNSFFFQYVLESCKRFQAEGLCLFWIVQPYLFIYDEEAYKILSNENTTINKPYVFDMFKEFWKDSVLASGDGLWQKRRKMLNPVFYTSNLKDKVQMINRNATLLVESLFSHNGAASFNIAKLLKVCAFRNIYEFMSGLELPTNENNPEVEFAIDCVDNSTEMIVYRFYKPWMHPRCSLFLFPKGRLFLKSVENAFKFADSVLNRMKPAFLTDMLKDRKETDDLGRNSHRSFREVIFEQHAKDLAYTHTDMQGEAITILSAGYDAIAHAMMWSLFLMGHHLDVQDKVYEEVESVMGCNNELSYDNVQNLKYLDCVVKESLRLYPPAPIYARRTVTDIKCGKYTVPKGTNIVFFPYLAHRNPDMFPNPEKFHPERFSTENSEKRLITYAFAEGIRNCIGKNFALMEIKIVLAHVIKNFKVTSKDRPEDISLNWEIMLTPVKPLRMCLEPRKQNTVQT